MLHKMTKTQVIAHVRKHGSWKGYLVGSNVNTFHIVGGWCLGYYVELFHDEIRGACVVGQETCEPTRYTPGNYNQWSEYKHFPRKFQDLIDNWTWYNANSETGMYPHFYQVK